MRGQSGFAPLTGNDFPNRSMTTLGAKIIMSFSGQSDSDSHNSACDLANYVLVDRASLAEVKSIIWELAEQLATLERAAYNLEACNNYWEAQLPDPQILERVEYFHSKFWDELPKCGLAGLNHQVIDLSRVLGVLADFAIAGEEDKWRKP
jgi:hypothetical protein